MTDLLKARIQKQGSAFDISYEVDHEVLCKLTEKRLGKTGPGYGSAKLDTPSSHHIVSQLDLCRGVFHEHEESSFSALAAAIPLDGS